MGRKILFGLAIFAAVLVVVALGFVGIVAMQPNEHRVERKATMNAPPDKVFAQVNDFQKWDAWSPWAKLDPAAKNTFEGPAEGEGSVFKWSGNDQVGEGSMTLTESKPHERIKIRLDFVKPMEDTSNVEFTFKPQGEKTEVLWSMDFEVDFMGKAMCMFMDLDKMVGDKFDEGLASLKGVVEAEEKGKE
jgi:uncharacterized protein YndB with AHSA1/START domain